MATYPATPVPQIPLDETIAYTTLISRLEGKQEQRRSKSSAAGRRKWKITYAVLTDSEVTTLFDFFIARKGAFEAFDFVNPNDSQTYLVRFNNDLMNKKRFAALLFSAGLEVIETNA